MTTTTIRFNSGLPPYQWMSNMHPCVVTFEGRVYQSTEAAYQAAKTLDLEARVPFQYYTGMQSKKAGRLLALRPDWNEVKGFVMGQVCREKFAPNTDLGAALVATAPAMLIEHAPWDAYWGSGKDGNGLNMMGKLLIKIRRELLSQAFTCVDAIIQ